LYLAAFTSFALETSSGHQGNTMDGIVIAAAVLCIIALALLLSAKIDPR
jgi:hypothetical protein